MRGNPSTEAGRVTTGYCMERPARRESTLDLTALPPTRLAEAEVAVGVERAHADALSEIACEPRDYQIPVGIRQSSASLVRITAK
jgi:hypothetical protein